MYPCFSENGYKVTAYAGTGGTVDGAEYSEKKAGVHTTASFTATPNAGYSFNNWTLNSNVSSNSTTSATISANAVYQVNYVSTNLDTYNAGLTRSLTANFTETMYNITASAETGGTVALASGKTAKAGVATTTQYVATAKPGYSFAGWALDGVKSSDGDISSPTIEINAIPSNSVHKLTAKFTEDKHNITASSQTGGTVSPVSAEAGIASTATFEATVTDTDHYEFDGWDYSGVSNVSVNGNQITVNADVSSETHGVTAKFKKVAYDVVFNSIGEGEPGNETITKILRYDSNKKIAPFYEIPERENCVFKGWYHSDGTVVNFDSDTFDENTQLIAHWIEAPGVAKDDNDTNIVSEGYSGYGLKGVQIREEGEDSNHQGEIMPGGLRFITSLSQTLLDEIDGIDGEVDGSNVEYGYAVTKKAYADAYAAHFKSVEDGFDEAFYKLKNCDANVNGVNTNPSSGFTSENDYRYVTNVNCTSEDYDENAESANRKYDHKKYDDYRLYSLVITYEDEGEADKTEDIIARPYLKYTDANGLLRYRYDNYVGTNVYGGCSVSYDQALNLSKELVSRQESD